MDKGLFKRALLLPQLLVKEILKMPLRGRTRRSDSNPEGIDKCQPVRDINAEKSRAGSCKFGVKSLAPLFRISLVIL